MAMWTGPSRGRRCRWPPGCARRAVRSGRSWRLLERLHAGPADVRPDDLHHAVPDELDLHADLCVPPAGRYRVAYVLLECVIGDAVFDLADVAHHDRGAARGGRDRATPGEPRDRGDLREADARD